MRRVLFKNKKVTGLLVLTPLLLSFATPCFAYPDGDWQAWLSTSVEGKTSDKKWKVKLEEEVRIGENVSEIFYNHTDFGATYKVVDFFSLGLNYRQVFGRSKGKWIPEYRPYIHGTFHLKLLDFALDNRNRLEYRIFKDKKDVWRYRNKTTLTFPWKWTSLEIQPYVADEIFIDTERGRVNRNRLYGGIKFKLMEHLKAQTFYLWQANESKGKWFDANVIGVKLKVGF